MRDILSSFQQDCLPSEFRPELFQEIIVRPRASDDPLYYRRPGRLEETLFRQGSYFTQSYEGLRVLESDDGLARHFCETLEKRFQALFEQYDQLRDPPASDGEPPPDLVRLIEGLRKYSDVATDDRSERRVRESRGRDTSNNDQRFASVLIKQIRALCQRSRVQPVRRQQRSPRSPPNRISYLFHEILGNASAETGFFGLELLKACTHESLERLQGEPQDGRGLRDLQAILAKEGASKAYQAEFATFVTQEDGEEEVQQG